MGYVNLCKKNIICSEDKIKVAEKDRKITNMSLVDPNPCQRNSI